MKKLLYSALFVITSVAIYAQPIDTGSSVSNRTAFIFGMICAGIVAVVVVLFALNRVRRKRF